MNNISRFREDFNNDKEVYEPIILRLSSPGDNRTFRELLEAGRVKFVCDEIHGQLEELIKVQNPSVNLKPDQYPELIGKHLAGRDLQKYGVWVYYPWNQRLVHLLDEEEFI